MILRLALFALFACTLPGLTGCGQTSRIDIDGNRVSMRNGDLHLRPTQGPAAIIAADGSLRIDGRTVELTGAQQAHLAEMHATALSLVDASLDIAKASGAVAAAAASEAIRSSLSGDSEGAEARVRARVNERLGAPLAALCDHFDRLYAIQQDLLADDMPAFEPYALFRPEGASRCREGQRELSRGT